MKMNLQFYRSLERIDSSVEDDYRPFEAENTVSLDKRKFWLNGSRPSISHGTVHITVNPRSSR